MNGQDEYSRINVPKVQDLGGTVWLSTMVVPNLGYTAASFEELKPSTHA